MIVKALLFINGFSLFIGLLILFLDKVISNYGICRITINQDKEFEAPGGKSLLRVLFENNYFIPSACGGKGTCGYCKLKVTQGGGQALPTESLILSTAELRQGFRLACQLKVREDLQVAIPAEYLEIKEYQGSIEYSETVASDIKKIGIRLEGEDRITFKAGQYVQIRVDTPQGLEYRAYSVASSPEETDRIELNVKLIPEGIGSSYMHSLKPGDRVQFSGPYGEFYLQAESARRIICVAGGVGLAPLKSIIAYWNRQAPQRELELYYGSRSPADLYDHRHFQELAEANSRFRYYPAVMESGESWPGDTGFIHTVMRQNMPSEGNSEAYLCGPPLMIEAVSEVLREKGVPKERILYDKF